MIEKRKAFKAKEETEQIAEAKHMELMQQQQAQQNARFAQFEAEKNAQQAAAEERFAKAMQSAPDGSCAAEHKESMQQSYLQSVAEAKFARDRRAELARDERAFA